MSYSNLPGTIGVIIGSALAPKFISRFTSPDAIERKWTAPYKSARPSDKEITQNAWPTGLFYTWIFASILIMPVLLLYIYPEIQTWLFADSGGGSDTAKLFRNNGQFLVMILWLFSGPFLLVLIGNILIHPFKKWRNRLYAHRIEETLIAAKKLKVQTNRDDNNRQLTQIARDYDLHKMSVDTIKRFVLVNIVVFLALAPLYLAGILSYTKIDSDGIAIAKVWSYSEELKTWGEVSSVEIFVTTSSSDHLEPHFDFMFQDGTSLNIWDLSIPMQSTTDLIYVRDLAESKSVSVNIDFPYQDLSALRENARTQIKEVMDAKTSTLPTAPSQAELSFCTSNNI